jgi:hypothetical protein
MLGNSQANSYGNSSSKVSLVKTWGSNHANSHHKGSMATRWAKCKLLPSTWAIKQAHKQHKVCSLARLLGNS